MTLKGTMQLETFFSGYKEETKRRKKLNPLSQKNYQESPLHYQVHRSSEIVTRIKKRRRLRIDKKELLKS